MSSSEQEKDTLVFSQWGAPLTICELAGDDHCLTCSDEALSARVVRVDVLGVFGGVVIGDQTEIVDISVVENVVPGSMLLVHAGVAIACLDEVNDV